MMNENENKPAEEQFPPELAAAAEPVELLQETEENEDTETQDREPARTDRRTSAPWPWMVLTAIAIAALIFVLVRDGGKAAGDNAVVGKMDGVTITKADMYDELSKQLADGQAASQLDSLMMMKLVDLEAKKSGVTATDADINAEIAKYRKNFSTDEEFASALQQNGMTMDILKEQIDISVKLRKIFAPEIKPTDDQLKKYYEDNKANYSTPEQIRASHILLPTKAEAEAVLAELKKGADFATLAKEKSTDPGSKDNGGDLNYFGRGVMNEPFETAAFKLKVGETSGVVESPNGFHIIKVTDKKAAVTPTYDSVKQQVENDYLDSQIPGKMNDWMTTKKKEYHYENLLSAPAASETPAPSASPSASTSAGK
uniref:peptidylprolyl isomerase n=2 Tax=Cohnella candidum TaxID=2674991 RepID=A0A3G3JX37_9BACL|nr:peptidylprolyl isomerase [Cohnella candidum]